MMKWLIIVLIVLFIIGSVKCLGMTASDTASHLVFIANNDEQVGSGIIVADGWVITCAHLVPKNKKVQVFNQPDKFNKKMAMAEVVYLNYDRDIALLKVPWAKGYVRFAEPYLDEEVIETGYTVGQKFTFHGRICRIDTGIAEVDMSASFGASGSGVYDVKTGELVGMVTYLRVLGPVGAPTVVGIIPSSLLSTLLEYTRPLGEP